jgi:GT2 family glycosyltransferase
VDRGNAEYILFLNDDCYAQRDDWLFNMQKILETDEKVGAVGALLLYPDGKTIQHCGVFFSSRTNNLPYHMHYRKSLEQVKNFVQVPRYYQAVTGACMLMRRKDFEDIGGLDKVYWYMYEDIKFCLDIKSKLQKFCVFCPGAILIHDEGISRDGKQNPKFRENIETFKKQCAGMYYNDLEFYLSNPKHMIYKHKA